MGGVSAAVVLRDRVSVHLGAEPQRLVAAAAGGVFKTKNAGVSFQPIFDGQGAYSIGCLAIDRRNPNIIWVIEYLVVGTKSHLLQVCCMKQTDKSWFKLIYHLNLKMLNKIS